MNIQSVKRLKSAPDDAYLFWHVFDSIHTY